MSAGAAATLSADAAATDAAAGASARAGGAAAGDSVASIGARKKAAAAEVAAIAAAQAAGALREQEMRERFYRYVLAKLGLGQHDAPSRNMEELAEASLARALKVSPAEVKLADRPATCDGARSVDVRQALLVMTVQREFGVRLDGLRAGLAETTDDLADLVREAFG